VVAAVLAGAASAFVEDTALFGIVVEGVKGIEQVSAGLVVLIRLAGWALRKAVQTLPGCQVFLFEFMIAIVAHTNLLHYYQY